MNNADTEMSEIITENDDVDQIPEVAAKVITKWFKEHQGVCISCQILLGV